MPSPKDENALVVSPQARGAGRMTRLDRIRERLNRAEKLEPATGPTVHAADLRLLLAVAEAAKATHKGHVWNPADCLVCSALAVLEAVDADA